MGAYGGHERPGGEHTVGGHPGRLTTSSTPTGTKLARTDIANSLETGRRHLLLVMLSLTVPRPARGAVRPAGQRPVRVIPLLLVFPAGMHSGGGLALFVVIVVIVT